MGAINEIAARAAQIASQGVVTADAMPETQSVYVQRENANPQQSGESNYVQANSGNEGCGSAWYVLPALAFLALDFAADRLKAKRNREETQLIDHALNWPTIRTAILRTPPLEFLSDRARARLLERGGIYLSDQGAFLRILNSLGIEVTVMPEGIVMVQGADGAKHFRNIVSRPDSKAVAGAGNGLYNYNEALTKALNDLPPDTLRRLSARGNDRELLLTYLRDSGYKFNEETSAFERVREAKP